MLADKTNFASSPSQKPGKRPGIEANVRTSKVTASLPIASQSWASENDPRAQQDEDDEISKRLKQDFGRIPALVSKYEAVFGNAEARAASDSAVLKKIPPDPKYPIASKTMDYLRQETTRLSEGYKKIRSQRDAWYHELCDMQRRHEIIFEKGTAMITRLRMEKNSVLRKAQDLEERCLNDRLQSARAKAALTREAELVAKGEQSLEEASRQLKTLKSSLLDCEERERSLNYQVQAAEEELAEQKRQLHALRQTLIEVERSKLLVEARQNEILEQEMKKHAQVVQVAEIELESIQMKHDEAMSERERVSAEIARLRTDNQKKAALIETLKERALDAETKLDAKDGNVNLALQTLRQSQEYNEQRIEVLTRESAEAQEKFATLSAEKVAMTDKMLETNAIVEKMRSKIEQLSSKVAEVERKAEESEAKLKALNEEAEAARMDALHKLAKYNETKEMLERSQENLTQEKLNAEAAITRLDATKSQIVEVESDLAEARSSLETMKSSPRKMERIMQEAREEEEMMRRANDVNFFKSKLEALEQDLEQAKKTLYEADSQRRSLLNELQNLKGNIRVVARVRPPSANSSVLPEKDRSKVICSVDGTNLSLELRGNQQRRGAMSAAGNVESHAFSFNRVFDRDATQQDVFDEVSSFVQSALDGYSVCLFSYGQTGSGKTWTMTGDLSHHAKKGIIPRSVDLILNSVNAMRVKGWSFDVECSFMEIYNESIRDLLALDIRQEKNARHEILHRNGQVVVNNIRRVAVNAAEDVQALLERADRNRSVAATDKNAESSRSHSVFTIHLVGRNPDKPGAELAGSLNLCDLAGSERVKTSHATGERLKETQAINSSLQALGLVFAALAQKAAHIPFRNTVLTHILSPCLSGDGKTLMIVNLSSDHDDAQESLCSLRFAQQVNKTELGKAKRNIRETS